MTLMRGVCAAARVCAHCVASPGASWRVRHGGQVFDYLNGSKQKTLYKHAGEVTKLIYCERDKTVISASRDLTIVVSDEMHPDRGNLLKEIKVSAVRERGTITAPPPPLGACTHIRTYRSLARLCVARASHVYRAATSLR